MDDAKIIDLYWQRSEQAIPETASKYGHYCYSVAHRIVNNREDSEECVNDTWLGAWNAIPPHRPDPLSVFLGKITRRLALGILRRENRIKRGGGQVTLAFEELSDCLPDEGADQIEESAALRELIRAFLDTLTKSERDVFLARYWAFASVEEISKHTGFSASKIKSMLYRTRQRFNVFLAREGYKYDKT